MMIIPEQLYSFVSKKIARKVCRVIPQIHTVLQSKRHYTILYEKNTILSIGWNLTNKTSPLAKRFNYGFDRIHSELAAISKVRDLECISQTKSVHAINIRLSKLGLLNISSPCKNCVELFRYFGIQSCVFSDEKGEFKEMII